MGNIIVPPHVRAPAIVEPAAHASAPIPVADNGPPPMADGPPNPPPPPPPQRLGAPLVQSSKGPPPKADGPPAPPLPGKIAGYSVPRPPIDTAPPPPAAPLPAAVPAPPIPLVARPVAIPPPAPSIPKSAPPPRIVIPAAQPQPQQGELHKTSPTLDRSAPVLASPLEGDDIYGSFHQDQFQRTQDLQKQVSALADRVEQVAASHQESHRSTTAIGVDATENVSRLGNEVERLKGKVNSMENGRDVEKLQTDLNALSAKVQRVELDQQRMERMETRLGEISDGFDLTEIRNHEWRENVMKDFEDIPKITPYYKKLLQEGKEFGPVLQHLSDIQEGHDSRIVGAEVRVGALAKTIDSGFKDSKQQLGRIQAYFPYRKRIDYRTQENQAKMQEHLEGLKRNQLYLGVGLAAAAAVGVGFAGWKLITGWLKKRRESGNAFGGVSEGGNKMPEMQQIGHRNVKRRVHARDWEVEGIARH